MSEEEKIRERLTQLEEKLVSIKWSIVELTQAIFKLDRNVEMLFAYLNARLAEIIEQLMVKRSNSRGLST